MKLPLLFTFIYILCLHTHAQTVLWQKAIGGNYDDVISKAIVDTNGNILIAAYSASSAGFEKSENSLGFYDYWIIKTDPDGNLIWENTIGAAGYDYATCIIQTEDGGYLVGGYSSSAPAYDKTAVLYGSFDYWLVKLDNDGEVLWDRSYGGDEEDYLYQIAPAYGGGYILMGESGSLISGNKTVENCFPPLPYPDYWYIKIDETGDIIWQKEMGGFSNDWGRCIISTSDGGYLIGGSSDSDINCLKEADQIGGIDYYITKINAEGNSIWQKDFGGNVNDYLSDIIQTFDNGFLLVGYSASGINGNKTEASIGLFDYWVVKLDPYGHIQWQNTIGADQNERLYHAIQTIDGNYLLAGESSSGIFADKTEASFGDYDYWFVELDPLGNILQDITFGGTNDDQLADVVQTNDYAYVLCGTSGSLLNGNKTVTSHGGDDIWIVKISHDLNLVQGDIGVDFDANGIIDGDDFYWINMLIQDETSGSITLSKADGSYTLGIPETGTYIVSAPALMYYDLVPSSYSNTYGAFGNVDTGKSFVYQPYGDFNDLCIDAFALTPFRPGFTACYGMYYFNMGTTTLPGTITFYPSEYITYDSCTVSPDLLSEDSIVWETPVLDPFEGGVYILFVTVNEDAPFDSTYAVSHFKIDPIIDDAGPECNFDTVSVLITSSFDPNNIYVDKELLSFNDLPSNPLLEYTINFQNTGTDTAFFVRLQNTLPEGLIVESITIKAVSDTITYFALDAANNLIFDFSNIKLPYADIDEAGSHGYLVYEIRTRSDLAPGDFIENSASIIFDYNAPILTDTAKTLIYLPQVNINDNAPLEISISPNPTGGLAKMQLNCYVDNAIFQLTGLDGKTIQEQKFSGSFYAFSCANLPAGIYLIHVLIPNQGEFNSRIVVQ
ncbi:MAG: T9SS type A sorting domain-containing protein [Chitinophagales bacterium]